MQGIEFNYQSVRSWLKYGNKTYLEPNEIIQSTAEAIFQSCSLTRRDISTLKRSLSDKYSKIHQSAHVLQAGDYECFTKTFQLNLVKGVWQTLKILKKDSIKLTHVSFLLAEFKFDAAIESASELVFESNRNAAFSKIVIGYLNVYGIQQGFKKIQDHQECENKELLLKVFDFITGNQMLHFNLYVDACLEDSEQIIKNKEPNES